MIAVCDRQAKGTAVEPARVPVDLAAYKRRIRSGGCFVCGVVRGATGYEREQVAFEDANHIAFLDGYPTLYGKVLVALEPHIKQVVGELPRQAFLELLTVVHRVATAVEAVVPSERTYRLSLGASRPTRHVHWHIAPLPAGTPLERQQFHALILGARHRPLVGRARRRVGRAAPRSARPPVKQASSWSAVGGGQRSRSSSLSSAARSAQILRPARPAAPHH